MDSVQSEAYFESIGLPQAGRNYVRSVRDNAPSRSVTEGGLFNVSSIIPSDTLNQTIQAESVTGEYAAVCEYEYDRTVAEYYDQLPPIRVRGKNRSGKNASWDARPDYLVIYTDRVEVHEIKDDGFIKKKLESGHPNWSISTDGQVHYAPLEERFQQMGVKYKIRPISEFNQILVRNYRTIIASRRSAEINNKDRLRIVKCFKSSGFLILENLIQMAGLGDVSTVIKMIDRGELFCDIKSQLLTDHKSLVIAPSADLLKYGHEFMDIIPPDKRGISTASKFPCQKDAEIALNRIAIIEAGHDSRSVRRWKKMIKEGKANGMTPFQCLIPKSASSGNRSPRLPDSVESVVQDGIETFFANPYRTNAKMAYVLYRRFAKTAHPDHEPVSEITFRRRIKMLSQSEIGFKRGGKRMMNANASTSDVSLRSLRAGVPFERAHLDHHLVKIFVKWGVDSENEYTERMWITVIIDEATDNVLARHFTFSSPSRYSLGAVIRDCVRRHGKLPEELVVDHGPDLKAVYFRALAAHYGVILTYRPKSKGASGSTVENFFKEFQDGWLCAAPGNMVDKPASRAVDGNVSARNTAEYSIDDLISEFDKYVSYRSAKLRGVRTETSSKHFDELHALYPMVGRAVKYDKDFLVATAIEQKEYTIERNCVKIDETRYSNTELIKLQQSNKKVEVRADPENPYLAYAWVERRWIDCGATGIVEFLQKTSYERMIQAIKIRGASHLRGEARKSAMDRLAGKISDAAEIRASENRIANEVVMVEPDEIKDRASSIFDDLDEGLSDSSLQTDKW